MVLGSQGTTVTGTNAALTLGVLQGTAENWTLRWNYHVLREAVSNQNVPLYGTGAFDGQFQSDTVLTTDNTSANSGFISRIQLTNGDLTVTSASLTYKDANGSSVIYNFACRWHQAEQQQRKDDFVRYILHGELIAPPTSNL